MQGQRGTISSITESMNFEYGSTSGGVAPPDQQLLWSNFQNPSQDQMRGFFLPVNDTSIRCVNSFSQEPRDLQRFGFSEPAANGTQNESSDNRQGTSHGRSDMTAFVGGATMLEGRERVHNSLFVRSTDSDATCQNLNLNVDLVNHGDDNFEAAEPSNQYKSSGAENQLIQPDHGSHGLVLSSRVGAGYSIEENDGHSSSFGGRRASCKRKALEGNIGQTSIDASPSFFTHAESNAWTGFPSQHNEERNLSISEQVNPRLRLAARMPASISDVAAVTSVESSRRNFQFTTNPSGQQELSSRGSTSRHHVSALSHQPPSLQIDNSLNMMASPEINHTQTANAEIRLPSLPQNVQSFNWNGASGSRSVAPSSPIVPRGRDTMPLQERRLRSTSRTMVNHPAFVPEVDFRTSGQNLSNRSSNYTSNVHGSLASTSRPRSGAVANLSSLAWASSSSPDSEYPQRFSELVRRSLLSSLSAESVAQSSSNHTPLPPGASTSLGELLFPPGVSNPCHHRSYPRSASWLQRQADGMVEVPHPLQTSSSGREGRSRLMVSEIRNVLDLMRRGEGLRIEDVMILDQSVFFGAADFHDRHRDMRLDVDNMSYEELLALEERIGNVCTGLDEATIFNGLKKRKWTAAVGGQSDAEPCCICQEDYNDGQDVGTLECGHDFHSECIKQWLLQKNLCPICKMGGLTK